MNKYERGTTVQAQNINEEHKNSPCINIPVLAISLLQNNN
jgi:hypothetical protein